MTARVGPRETARGYKYFTLERTVACATRLEERTSGIRELLENDTRARCYAEYACGGKSNKGTACSTISAAAWRPGIVVDGKLYYGRAASRGEFGHIPSSTDHLLVRRRKVAL